MPPPRPNNDGVPLADAARVLGRSPSTLRRWIAEHDAPTVRLGRGARGHGCLVDPDQLKAWYAQRHSLNGSATHGLGPDHLAPVFWDFLKRDCDLGMPAHRVLDIPEADAAGYLALLFRYVAIRLGRDLADADYPEPIKLLLDIARTRARG